MKDERIVKLFNEIEHEYYSHSTARIARLRVLTLSLLIILREEYADNPVPPRISYDYNESVRAAISFIRSNYTEKFTLDDIAKSTYSNKYVLSRQFKRIMGQTIVDYANAYRIKQASALISGGSTVGEAARLCGFNNLSFFSKTFKRYTGCLPIDFKSK
jgi:AraC-like DNA-binding protein